MAEDALMREEVNEMLDDLIQPEEIAELAQEPEPEIEQEQEQEQEVDEPEIELPEESVETDTVPQDELEEEVEDQPQAAIEEVEEEPEDEVPDLVAINKRLIERVEELSGKILQPGASQGASSDPVTEPTPVAEQTPTIPAVAPPGPTNYLEGLDIEQLLDDPAKLNEVLNSVANNARTGASQQAVQQVLQSIPEMVVGYITRHTAMTNLVNDFYREHPDLANVKQTVGAIANDVQAEHSDWNAESIFSETADRTRKFLGIKQEQKVQVKKTERKPAFAKARGARKEAPKVTGLQKELNELMEDEL